MALAGHSRRVLSPDFNSVATAARRPLMSFFLAAHSQTTNTLQPACCKRDNCLWSRSTLALNFSVHLWLLVEGVYASLQASCRCQKQPCTNKTVRYLGKTRSGLPGNSRLCSLKRNPNRCKPLRILISGFVSLPLMEAIIFERLAGSTISVIPGNLAL